MSVNSGKGGAGAIAGDVGEPASHRVADVLRPMRVTVERGAAGSDPRRAEQQLEHLLVAALRWTGEAEDLTASQRERDAVDGPAHEMVDGEALRPGRDRTSWRWGADGAAHDELHQLRAVDPCRFHRGDDPAVAEDGGGAGSHDLAEPMRDDEHRVPAPRVLVDQAPDALGVPRGQCGRGLVEHEHAWCARVVLEGPCDGEHRPGGEVEGAHHGVRLRVDVEAQQGRRRVPAQGAPVDPPGPARRDVRADGEVLGDREVGEQTELLVDESETGSVRPLRRGAPDGDLRPVDGESPARVGTGHAREDPEQRRLAGSVAPDHCVDRARRHREGDVAERVGAGI